MPLQCSRRSRSAICEKSAPAVVRRRMRRPERYLRQSGTAANGRSDACVKYSTCVSSNGHIVSSCALRNSQVVAVAALAWLCMTLPRGSLTPLARAASARSGWICAISMAGVGARNCG